MAGWILTIQKELPHHLDYAVDEGFWDCTSNSGIQAGDDLFFWQAGASLVAHCVATGSPYPIDEDVPKPWDDRQVRPYTHRIPLRLLSRDVAEPPRWRDLQQEIGSRARASNGIVPINDPFGVPRVQQRFRYAPDFS